MPGLANIRLKSVAQNSNEITVNDDSSKGMEHALDPDTGSASGETKAQPFQELQSVQEDKIEEAESKDPVLMAEPIENTPTIDVTSVRSKMHKEISSNRPLATITLESVRGEDQNKDQNHYRIYTNGKLRVASFP